MKKLTARSDAPPTDAAPPAPLLSTVAAEFIAAKAQALSGSSYLQRQRVAIDVFIDIAGDRPVDDYRARDLQDFVTILGQLPRDWRKIPRFRAMAPREVAAYNEGLRQPERRLTTTSINDYLASFRQFWRAVRADHANVRDIIAAPISRPRSAARPTARDPLEVDDLNAWLAHAASQPRPDDRWLPLLGLLTGARLGELVFLQGQDIVKDAGHWTANLRGDLLGPDGVRQERQLKTDASRRIFALHDVLEELGFIEWARHRPGFLFDLLHRRVKPASTASKRMLRQMKIVGIHVPQQGVFHSLRHTTEDWLRDSGADPRTQNLQVGHALVGVSERYGKKTLRRPELVWLATLALPAGLDLDPYRNRR